MTAVRRIAWVSARCAFVAAAGAALAGTLWLAGCGSLRGTIRFARGRFTIAHHHARYHRGNPGGGRVVDVRRVDRASAPHAQLPRLHHRAARISSQPHAQVHGERADALHQRAGAAPLAAPADGYVPDGQPPAVDAHYAASDGRSGGGVSADSAWRLLGRGQGSALRHRPARHLRHRRTRGLAPVHPGHVPQPAAGLAGRGSGHVHGRLPVGPRRREAPVPAMGELRALRCVALRDRGGSSDPARPPGDVHPAGTDA